MCRSGYGSWEEIPLHKLTRTRQTLERRAATLRTLLTHSTSEDKLLKAAERVRDARIQVLRARIGEMPSVLLTPQQHKQIAKLGDQIELLRATTAMVILAEFRIARRKASDDSRLQTDPLFAQ